MIHELQEFDGVAIPQPVSDQLIGSLRIFVPRNIRQASSGVLPRQPVQLDDLIRIGNARVVGGAS